MGMFNPSKIDSSIAIKTAIASLFALAISLVILPASAFAASQLSVEQPTDIGSNGYHVIGNSQAEVHSVGAAGMLSDPLPSSYRTQNMTSVKDQGKSGMCWAFCIAGAAEASAIVNGLANSSLDLSERHLAYYFYNNATDPLGGTAGDLNATNHSAPVDFMYDNGGDARLASFELASWKGFIAEEDAPMAGALAKLKTFVNTNYSSQAAETQALNNILTEYAVDEDLAYDGILRLKNCHVVSNTNADLLKREIMAHGAGVGNVSSGQEGDSNYWAFDQSRTNMYCFDSSHRQIDHGILIVGWDDNYDRQNFVHTVKTGVTSPAPQSNGAWICRNSWGTSVGMNGYFYLSYEDIAFNTDANNTVFFDVTDAAEYDNNYQYDGTMSSVSVGLPSGSQVANIFTAKANPGKFEVLKAVSVDVNESCVDCSIQIYKNPEAGNPTSGIAMLSDPVETTLKFAGFHTIDLGQDICLNQGDIFAVVMTLSEGAGADGNGTVSLSMDSDYSSGWIAGHASVLPGTSYINYQGWRDFSEGKIVKDLPCSVRIKAFTCNSDEYVCGHNVVLGVVEATEATCTKDGSIKYWICTDCGVYLSNSNITIAKELDPQATVQNGGIIVPALGHNMATWTETKAPTCLKAGTETSTCTRCNVTQTRAGRAALGHDMSAFAQTVDPTCTEDGAGYYNCSRCGASGQSIVVPKLGHDMGPYAVTTAATCAKAGVETSSCSRCDYAATRSIKALGHTLGDYVETTAPTCTEAAVETATCVRCDVSKTREGRAALGHTLGDYAVTTAATCAKAGVETSSCSRCDYAATRSIKALGHTLGDYVETTAPTCTEAAVETATCVRCDVSKTREGRAALGHEYGEPYVVTDAQCVYDGVARRDCVRGDDYQEHSIPATGHTLELVQGQPAACETDGFSDHYECRDCGFLSADSKGNTPVSFSDLTLKATGHDMGEWYEVSSPTCEDDGCMQRDCSKCSYFETQNTDANGHAWADEYTIDQEPTYKTPGGKSIHCTACDAKTDFQVIPALGQTPLSACELVVNQSEFAYTGSYFKPDFTLFLNGEEVDPSLYTISPTKGYYTVGPHTIKITAVSGDTPFMGTTSVSMLVKPKATSITKLTRGTKYFKVYWSKRSTQTSGYQVRYSLYEDMHSYSTKTITSYKTTYKKVSSLKKKRTYYVMVRTYKTVSGKKYYSEWSAIKKVTTK